MLASPTGGDADEEHAGEQGAGERAELCITRILALFKPTKQKLSTYECGFEPFSDARGKYDILFYVVAILFVLFDIEIILILPWVMVHSYLPVSSYFLLHFFIFTLLLGFGYEWRNGALNWTPEKVE